MNRRRATIAAGVFATAAGAWFAAAPGLPVWGFGPRGPLAWVSNERAGSITVIDTSADRVVDTIAVGSRPRGIRLSPDDRTLYVAVSDQGRNTLSDGDAVLAIDTASRRIVGRYEAGTDPEQFAISPDGRRLFSANEDAGRCSSLGDVTQSLGVTSW